MCSHVESCPSLASGIAVHGSLKPCEERARDREGVESQWVPAHTNQDDQNWCLAHVALPAQLYHPPRNRTHSNHDDRPKSISMCGAMLEVTHVPDATGDAVYYSAAYQAAAHVMCWLGTSLPCVRLLCAKA